MHILVESYSLFDLFKTKITQHSSEKRKQPVSVLIGSRLGPFKSVRTPQNVHSSFIVCVENEEAHLSGNR